MENVYIKFDDIEGEGTEKNHEGWIPVKNLDWGLARTLDINDLGTTQRGFANTTFEKINMTTELSKASPKVMQSVANGTVRPKVIIELCRSGDDPKKGMEPYLKVTLEHSTIDSYSVSAGEEQIPEENWALTYRRIEIEYKSSDPKTGKIGKPEGFIWDLLAGTSGA